VFVDIIKKDAVPEYTDCPKCGSKHTHSYDNQPLFHPSQVDVDEERSPKVDTMIEVEMQCEGCGNQWGLSYDLVPQK
jgi:hypothetical protein